MIVVAEFPPMPLTERITAGLEPFLMGGGRGRGVGRGKGEGEREGGGGGEGKGRRGGEEERGGLDSS